jgi:hypothetical protein
LSYLGTSRAPGREDQKKVFLFFLEVFSSQNKPHVAAAAAGGTMDGDGDGEHSEVDQLVNDLADDANQHHSMCAIQAGIRGKLERKRIVIEREVDKKHVVVCQRLWRWWGCVGQRGWVKVNTVDPQLETAWFQLVHLLSPPPLLPLLLRRCCLPRRNSKKQRQEERSEKLVSALKKNAACTATAGQMARKVLRHLRREKAALYIQRLARARLARNEVTALKLQRDANRVATVRCCGCWVVHQNKRCLGLACLGLASLSPSTNPLRHLSLLTLTRGASLSPSPSLYMSLHLSLFRSYRTWATPMS